MHRIAPAALLCAAVACGGAQGGSGRGPDDLSQFSCDERRAEYMVAGGFVAAEAGVTVECSGNDPRLTKWRMDESGARDSSTHRLTSSQFEDFWRRIDSTGWRYLDGSCANPNAAQSDPLYTIVVADHASNRTYTCAGRTLPFPYDRLVNELDLRAAGLGDTDAPAR